MTFTVLWVKAPELWGVQVPAHGHVSHLMDNLLIALRWHQTGRGPRMDFTLQTHTGVKTAESLTDTYKETEDEWND